jgi:hypothetical protein
MTATARTQTELAAANGALDHVGEPPIVSLDAAFHRARACKRNIAKARVETLCMHDFNFSTAWETLTGAEEVEAGTFAYFYALPTGCLKVRSVQGLEENSWAVEADVGGVLTGLVTSAVDPVVCMTIDVPRLSIWDPLAFAVLELVLAAKINPTVGKDRGLTGQLLEQAAMALRPAKQHDAKQEARGDVRQDTTWLTARGVGGSRRRR